MYNRQKGLPLLISLAGLIITIFSIAIALGWSVEVVNNIKQDRAALSDTLPYAIVWIFPYFMGRFILGLFPSVQNLPTGIRIDKGLGFAKTILWDEIENIIERKNETIVLIINSKGLSAFNGLYFNEIYGRFLNIDKPIVLFSPSLENREEILQEIINKSSIHHIKKSVGI